MADVKFTHAQLAAKLIVEGSLDKIAGRAKEKFPVQSVPLNDEQRASFGREPGGTTLFYPVDSNGVFIDFHGAATTVWYGDADASEALKLLEKALKKAYPKARQKEDKPHTEHKDTRQRSYDVPLGEGRAAVVDVAYPAPGVAPRKFLVRILAYAKHDAPAPAPEPEKKKKKGWF
jgi:hypothetical protein